MLYYEFVCTKCEDKTPMTYVLKVTEWGVREAECWVCGGVAKRTYSEIEGVT